MLPSPPAGRFNATLKLLTCPMYVTYDIYSTAVVDVRTASADVARVQILCGICGFREATKVKIPP